MLACGAVRSKELQRIGHPLFYFFESLLKAGAVRARSCPYLELSATPTRKNGGQSGPMGEIEMVGPETDHGRPPDALSGTITGFQGES